MDIKAISKEPVLIRVDDSLAEALQKMLTEHTNTLLVIDDDGLLVGEVSVADIFDGIVPAHFDGDAALSLLEKEEAFSDAVTIASDTPVEDFMMADVRTITPNATLLEVASIAIAEHKARIPVVDQEGRPIGIISRQGLKQILNKYMQH